MIVLDTNVLSETLKPSPSPIVMEWLNAQPRLSIFITTITQAELLFGIESLPAGKRKLRLSGALEKIFANEFEGRILTFDEVSARWFSKIVIGRNAIGRPISQLDAMIASIARAQRATLATRNAKDFAHCDVRIVNPWD